MLLWCIINEYTRLFGTQEYPLIQVSKENQYPRYPSIRIFLDNFLNYHKLKKGNQIQVLILCSIYVYLLHENAIFGHMGSFKGAAQKHQIINYVQLLSSVFSCFHGLKII